ncbi:MAG TPA: hypothetical protein DEF51_50430 [Myxococcales bacterium]|nr:hypothetical protein [Myxococcales bacterium]
MAGGGGALPKKSASASLAPSGRSGAGVDGRRGAGVARTASGYARVSWSSPSSSPSRSRSTGGATFAGLDGAGFAALASGADAPGPGLRPEVGRGGGGFVGMEPRASSLFSTSELISSCGIEAIRVDSISSSSSSSKEGKSARSTGLGEGLGATGARGARCANFSSGEGGR